MAERKCCNTCTYRRSTCTVPPFDSYCDVLGDNSVLVRKPNEKSVCKRWASLREALETAMQSWDCPPD